MVATPSRHAIGLFEGSRQLDALVAPFIRDGLVAGDRVVFLVESPERTSRRLRQSVAIGAALDTGQLELSSWSTTYIDGGTFKASRMLARMRRILRESGSMGYRGIRIIGDMGWAIAAPPGIADLLAYESGLRAILARPRVSVLCVYDIARLSAGQIAELLTAHDAALTGGSIHRTTAAATGSPPRDRILDAAALLFPENGISRTGVDTLIAAAGVAKATFYRHFKSKEALIVAWLRDPRTRWFDRARATAEAEATSPTDLIRRLFDYAGEWLENEDFVGCPYLNTATEIPDGPASDEARAYLAEIGSYLERQLAAAGRQDAAALGRELHLMLAGAISLGVANRTTAFILAARDAAVSRVATAPAEARSRNSYDEAP